MASNDRESGEDIVFMADRRWEYGSENPAEAGKSRASFGRRDELEVVVKMLSRHYEVDQVRARSIVWTEPGTVEAMFRSRGRPPKPHLIRMANLADDLLSQGRQIRWGVVHRTYVAWNHPGELKKTTYKGEEIWEPRDSEHWQRAVRRIRNRLRAEADALACKHGLTTRWTIERKTAATLAWREKARPNAS